MLIIGIIGFGSMLLASSKPDTEEIIVVGLSSAFMSVGVVKLFNSIRSR